MYRNEKTYNWMCISIFHACVPKEKMHQLDRKIKKEEKMF